MPLDKNGVPIRNIEPDLFGDEGKPKKAAGKSASIGFLLGPKELQRNQRIKIGENDLEIEQRLKWAKFVADEKILKTDNRKKLKGYLAELLEGLELRYTSKTAILFPGNMELAQLTKIVTELGKVLGVQKAGFGDLLSTMKRIENRFKISLVGFADDLRNRLTQIPASPASVVHQAAKQSAENRAMLELVAKFLTDESGPDESTPWEAWYQAIRQLKFSTSTLMAPGEGDLLQIFSDAKQRKIVAYLLLMDLRRQQLEWNNEYRDSIKPSLQWIYLLQRPEDYSRLSQTFYGTAFTPDAVTKELTSMANRERRNRSYRKSVNQRQRRAKK